MKFEVFERAAREAYEEIPEQFKDGIDGLTVSREALAHPELPEVYTLGHCVTDEHLSDYGSPDTTRSVIALYWGSFAKLAELDPDFDWGSEMWETLTHELQHHLESLAGADALEGVDYAADHMFRRDEGLDFDPWYYQRGDSEVAGIYRVEQSWYVEQEWRADDFETRDTIDFEWEGAKYVFDRPEALGDVHFVWIKGLDEMEGSLEVVLVRKRSWWGDVKRLTGTYRPIVYESEASVKPSA
jgi:predicted Zn-dependent protease with MMP-like domain